MAKTTIRLYPDVKVQRQSFKGTKRLTVPNQSMSLREILRRFVKREALPVMREGVYEDRMEDLEKLAKADPVIQMEKAQEWKEKGDAMKKAAAEKAAKERAAFEEQQKKARENLLKELRPPDTPVEPGK